MADHLDEPPQKKAKKDPFQGPDSSKLSIYFYFSYFVFVKFLKHLFILWNCESFVDKENNCENSNALKFSQQH